MARFLAAFPILLVVAAFAWQDGGRPDQEELEARFEKTMSGCRLVGFFTMDDAPADEPLHEESYTIHEVSKLTGTEWELAVGIAFGQQSVDVEFVIDVEWAGDTPVFTVTEKAIPMLGTYSARVVIYGDRYAGIWQGKGHGGHLFGRVVPAEEEDG